MVDEQKYENSFETISFAGTAKSAAMEAIAAGSRGDFDEAEQLLKQAEECMLEAHHLQTNMITQEMRGNSVEVNIILLHAMDHLSMAQTAMDMAAVILQLQKEVKQLKEEK